MGASFLDSKISKKNQMRLIVGLLCIKILYTILINVVDATYSDSSDLQKIFFNVSIVLIFLYLYKYIRYDLELQLFFAFISIEVLINIYYILLRLYKIIEGISTGDTAFGGYEQTYTFTVVISLLKIVAVIGIAIQLLLNKYFKNKIRVAIHVLGVSFLLQIIGPFVAIYLIGMLQGTSIESSVIDNMYTFTYLFFNIIAYVIMVGLYVLTLDQDDADILTEKEL